MRTDHPIYDTVEKWIEADQEQNHTVLKMLDRRGRCERCGCSIDGIGICDKCTGILDDGNDGIVNPDDGALRNYLRDLRDRGEME